MKYLEIVAHIAKLQALGLLKPPNPGPGTQLKNILTSLGITANVGCGCVVYAADMNRRGVQWSRDNIDLIARQMESEAKQRGWKLPLMRQGAKALVRLAIWKAVMTTARPASDAVHPGPR